jgi:hypothetical protein
VKGLGAGQRKVCNMPPPRGPRRGNGQKVRRHSLDRLHRSMTKKKKRESMSEARRESYGRPPTTANHERTEERVVWKADDEQSA